MIPLYLFHKVLLLYNKKGDSSMNFVKKLIKMSFWIQASTITPEWILSLNIPKRKPQNLNSTEHKILIDLVNLAYEIIQLKEKRFSENEIQFKEKIFDNKLNMLRMSKEEIQSLFINNKENIVKKQIGTYIKHDVLSYDKFLSNVDTVEKMLESLKSYHREAAHNLKIKFVGSTDIKSKAKYKSDQDTILINSSKVIQSDEYAGLNYVIVHELGHRYLKFHPQRWDYDNPKWITTKYSMVDSMTGEEKFAELFALSNWKSKYSQFSDKIKKFEDHLK